jgi:hypothetical protein
MQPASACGISARTVPENGNPENQKIPLLEITALDDPDQNSGTVTDIDGNVYNMECS